MSIDNSLAAQPPEGESSTADNVQFDEQAGRNIPRFIGKCRVFRLIASGGMGEVYEGEQPGPKRLVAIKVVRHDKMSLEAVERFIEEARITANLEHNNIAKVYDVDADRSYGAAAPVHPDVAGAGPGGRSAAA